MAEKIEKIDDMFSIDAQGDAKSFSESPKAMKKWHSERQKTLGDLQKKHGETMKKMGYSEGMSPSDLPDKRFAGDLGWLGSEPEGVKRTMPEMYEYYINEKKHNGPFGKPEYQTYASIFPEGEDKPRTENFNRWSQSGKNYRMLSDAYIRKGKDGDYWYRQTNADREHPISERRASELFESDYAERAKREENARQEEEAARKDFAKKKDFIDETEAMRMMGQGVDEDAEIQIAGGATISAAPESGYILSYGEGKNLSMFDISEEQARDLIQANDSEIAEFIADMYDGAPTRKRYASRNFEGGSERKNAEKKPAPQPEQKPAPQPQPEQKPAEQPKPEQKPVDDKPKDNKPSGNGRPPKSMQERIIFNRAMKAKSQEEGVKILKDALKKAVYDLIIPYFIKHYVPMI